MNDQSLSIFGEVLFDHFPDGKRVLGGAPFNVAWHLQAFGQAPHFISRVGADTEGESIRTAMREWGMDTSGLQTDPALATGRVEVALVDGEPAYDIVHPCAYDAIESESSDKGKSCHLLYHGSLALREAGSRHALDQWIKQHHPRTVFLDVNLRPPWWNQDTLRSLLRTAHWVKLNADELFELLPASGNRTPNAADFMAEFELEGLVVTHGGEGAEALTASGEHHHVRPTQNIDVVDTVGAGDAFTSVFILGLTNDWPLDLTLQRAQIFASSIVGNRGATVNDPAFYQPFIDEWKLTS